MTTQTNTSGLHPCGQAVLVEPYTPETQKSIIAMPETVKERNAAIETRVVVIEIGAGAWADEAAPRAAVGDKVLVSKFAGVIAIGPKDGKSYRLINSNDIFCRIEE